MKTTIFSIFVLFAFWNISNAQVTIQCPADVTVGLFDLDQDLESYGEPLVNSNNGHTVDKQITVIDANCDGQTITLKYVATENSTANTAFCIQEITVSVPLLSDIIWPAQTYEIENRSPGDLDPDVSLSRPEPDNLLNGGSSTSGSGSPIYTTYTDQVIQSNTSLPYKVVRTWTALDWCTAETASFVQVLKINSLASGSFGVLDVETCNGSITTVEEVNVTTDQIGFTLDLSNCSLVNNDLVGYLNCIADNNNIDPSSSLILDIVGNDDPLNGVSTLDMVLIQRHILGIAPFDIECNVLAADLTNDGRVTALDLLMMRKLILGIIPSLPSSPSWIFINEFQSTTVPLSPVDLERDFKFLKAIFPLESLVVKAIKIGDVNGSAAN